VFAQTGFAKVFRRTTVANYRFIPNAREVRTMNRALLLATAATVAIGTASLAMADPASQPVPNMTDNAVLGQPCNTTTGRFIFGYDASGKVLACGGSGRPGIWVDPGTLIGVRQIGSKCVAEIHTLAPDNTGLFTAQSPDGVALFCAYPTDTWEPRPYR
jgi:hypothetical protein